MIGELTGFTVSVPVVGCPEVCIHEVPPEMSPVMQAMGWRTVLTWVMAPLSSSSRTSGHVCFLEYLQARYTDGLEGLLHILVAGDLLKGEVFNPRGC